MRGLWELYYLCSFPINPKLFQNRKLTEKKKKKVGEIFPISSIFLFGLREGEYKYKE